MRLDRMAAAAAAFNVLCAQKLIEFQPPILVVIFELCHRCNLYYNIHIHMNGHLTGHQPMSFFSPFIQSHYPYCHQPIYLAIIIDPNNIFGCLRFGDCVFASLKWYNHSDINKSRCRIQMHTQKRTFALSFEMEKLDLSTDVGPLSIRVVLQHKQRL